MPISNNADYDEIKQHIHQWLNQHYPHIKCPGNEPLQPEKLLVYYEHCEVALIEMKLLDEYPEFMRMIRRIKNQVKRLTPQEYKKEIFRSRVAFK
ncbi:MAG TPA: hypothetical protein VIQ03_13250 [Gammaproteobacteria bacterium]